MLLVPRRRGLAVLLLLCFLFILPCLLTLVEAAGGGRDFYKILGVPRDVNDRALKRAYHKLSMKWSVHTHHTHCPRLTFFDCVTDHGHPLAHLASELPNCAPVHGRKQPGMPMHCHRTWKSNSSWEEARIKHREQKLRSLARKSAQRRAKALAAARRASALRVPEDES